MPIPPPIAPATPGFDREKTIEQLIEVERKPVYRINKEIKEDNQKIQAWEKLKERSQLLQKLSAALHNFENPFRKRLIVSSNPEAVSGTVRPGTKPIGQKWKVLQLASDHEIRSDPQNATEKQIPAGRFSVAVGSQSQNFTFSGGTLQDFTEYLTENDNDLFNTEKTTDRGKTYLRLKSKIPGEAGRMHFRDPDRVLAAAGLTQTGPKVSRLDLRKSGSTGVDPNSDAETLEVQKLGKNIRLRQGEFVYRLDAAEKQYHSPSAWQSKGGGQNPPVSFLMRGKALEILTQEPSRATGAIQTNPDQSQDQSGQSPDSASKKGPAVEVGPEVDVDVEGELLFQAKNISRRQLLFPDQQQPSDQAGDATPSGPFARVQIEFLVASRSSAQSGAKKKGADGAQDGTGIGADDFQDLQNLRVVAKKEVRVGLDGTPVRLDSPRAPDVIRFSTEDDVLLSALRLDFGKGDKSKYQLSQPQDSRINIDGIEVRRNKKRGLDDLIPNSVLDLHKKTGENDSSPPIDVRVTQDAKAVQKEVGDWVRAYNSVISYLRTSAHAPISELNEESDESPGLLIAETTARTLQYALQEMTLKAYPPYSEKKFRTLAGTGIHTGKPGASFETVREALLKIDGDKFKQAIDDHPEELSFLFTARAKRARNQKKSLAKTDGLAIQMNKYLESYNQSGNGVIANQVNSLKYRISRNKRTKVNMEASLERKEEQLRRDFGRMEQAIRRSKETQKYLNRQLRNNNGDE